MKTPLKWLREYVDINVDAEEFARRMILCGFEVEETEHPGAAISGVVVGRLTRLEKHPNADRLQLCTVDAGGERPLTIVTGATNVFEGALVPVALVGAKLNGGLIIKLSKLRGVESEGMLCSGEELGIDDAMYPGASVDGILIFREDYKPGADAKPIVGLGEPVIDFKITANRSADCMCMQGIAREASVMLGTALTLPKSQYRETGDGIANDLKVTVKDAQLCPRYMARVVRNMRIAESPLWMRQALAAAGVRPINNIVDITNFVMLETGQPMHAFDHRYIRGREIVVRRAGEGEKLLTLDGKERTLTSKMLVIADGEGPVALAGIMGGELSGIFDDTQTVVFESANFEWSQVRLTSKAQGMRTESSARFEKGLAPYLAEEALDRAMSLIELLGAGEIARGAIDCKQSLPEKRKITASAERINRLLGQAIESGEMAKILMKLGFEVTCSGDALGVTVPLWRQDVETYADLAEEVQRVYGYHTIPSVPPPGEALMGRRTRRQLDMLKIRDLLCGMGLDEAVTYSFMAPAALDKLMLPEGDALRDAVKIVNPIGEDMSLMRTTMAPSMLRSVAVNRSRKAEAVRLFEVGRTYKPDTTAKPLDENGGYIMSQPCLETETLCVAIADDKTDFYALKGCIEELLARFGTEEAGFRPGAPCYYHPGRSAGAYFNGERVAWLGQVYPDVAEAFEAGESVYLAELNIDVLLRHARPELAIKPLPKFPSVSRDLAVSVGRECPVGGMLSAIRRAGGALLESAELFDIYEGKQVGEGKKSVAFSLTFRAADHTLVDEESNRCFDAVVAELGKEYGAEIRK